MLAPGSTVERFSEMFACGLHAKATAAGTMTPAPTIKARMRPRLDDVDWETTDIRPALRS